MWLGNEIGITFKKCRISIMKIDSNLGKGSQIFRCDIYMGVWKPAVVLLNPDCLQSCLIYYRSTCTILR